MKQKIKNKWLFIEPYVYLKLLKSNFLLYNTINGKYIIGDNKSCIDLLKKLKRYVVRLNKKNHEEKSVQNLLKKIKKNYLGDIIDSEKKPVIIPPKLNKNYLFRSGRREVVPEHLKGYDIKKNLLECSIYINSVCDQNCEDCNQNYKQVTFCTRSCKNEFELSVNDIKYILCEFVDMPFKIMNILGGNILRYSDLNSLMNLLSKSNAQKVFHIQYMNILEHIDNIKKLQEIGTINVLINSNFDYKILENVCELIISNQMNYRLSFLITKNQDIENTERFITENKVTEYLYYPIYNGKNIKFFKNNVFVNRTSIFQSTLSIKEIWARNEINQLNYGKLILFYDKNIYSNFNFKRLGILYKDSINAIISEEIQNKKSSWRITRKNVYPCKKCIYHDLCPPISNYEYNINKNNLCNIKCI